MSDRTLPKSITVMMEKYAYHAHNVSREYLAMGATFANVLDECKKHGYGFRYILRRYKVQPQFAMQLLCVHRAVKAKHLTPAQIEHVGWGRLRVIAHLLDGKEAGYWIKMAEQRPIRELKAMTTTGSIDRMKSVTFVLSEAERDELFDTLTLFGAVQNYRGFDGVNEALMKLARSVRVRKPHLALAA